MRLNTRLPFLVLALSLGGLPAAGAQTPITLDQAMAHPDWIGPPVESPWWSWDGRSIHYKLKRAGSPLRDIYSQPVAGGAPVRIDEAGQPTLDAPSPVFDRARTRMAFARNGDIFERDLRSGALTQVTRSA